MKVGKKKETIKHGIGTISEKSKNILHKGSKIKGISFKNISQLRLSAFIIILSVIYTFYGNSDKTLNRQFYVKKQIKKCQNDIDSLNNRIIECQKIIDRIDNDDRFLEEFAREKYYMAGRNEEIVIIEKSR